MIHFKEHITSTGEKLLYVGNPKLSTLNHLAEGPGDLWHSSLDQGYKNTFQDLQYQTAIYWWFINDFENTNISVSWRINSKAFVIREKIWKSLGGFDKQYQSETMAAIEFGYNLLRNNAGIPLYVKNLYPKNQSKEKINISTLDRYLFYFKNVKPHHAYYMLFRKGLFNFFTEFKALQKAKKIAQLKKPFLIQPRKLKVITGKPTVSLVIPTMRRQKHTQLLLSDHKKQTYLIKEAIIVDATPIEERNQEYYTKEDYPFEIKVIWQTTKGSCKARNEAISLCTGDYIIFADDDIRILPDFVENHIKLLQTYNADACNGLDIMAGHENQDLTDLKKALKKIDNIRWKVGISSIFSNANSCVKKEMVTKLIGNDINFDGGYGEDADFGLSILKNNGILLHNPFSANLHLKPTSGGYRWWNNQAKIIGKKRKKQPWELDKPVKMIRPVPSPTITYGVLKHFTPHQIKEWRYKHFFIYLFKKELRTLPIRILKLPYKQVQFSKSLKYAKALINLGVRYK